MEKVKQINDELTVATGQVTSEQLQQAATEGFKSVMNLRSPDEEGFLRDEQQSAEAVGLKYLNIPVKVDMISDELTDRVLQQIDELPKPALIHCKSGMRSGAMALMNVATRQGMTADEALEKGKQIGFDCDAYSQMKEFFKHYVGKHSSANK